MFVHFTIRYYNWSNQQVKHILVSDNMELRYVHKSVLSLTFLTIGSFNCHNRNNTPARSISSSKHHGRWCCCSPGHACHCAARLPRVPRLLARWIAYDVLLVYPIRLCVGAVVLMLLLTLALLFPDVLALARIEGLQRIQTDSSSAGLLPAVFTDYVDAYHFAAQASDPPAVRHRCVCQSLLLLLLPLPLHILYACQSSNVTLTAA